MTSYETLCPWLVFFIIFSPWNALYKYWPINLYSGTNIINTAYRREKGAHRICGIWELLEGITLWRLDWWISATLLVLSELVHIVNTVQEFQHKMLPFIWSSRNKVNEVCLGGPMKQVALQIVEKLKTVNFTKLYHVETLLTRLLT
jgi:hypothetical protein